MKTMDKRMLHDEGALIRRLVVDDSAVDVGLERLAVVVGEGGSGKSALLREAERLTQGESVRVGAPKGARSLGFTDEQRDLLGVKLHESPRGDCGEG